MVRMPLPSDARPAVGTDGQLVVINMDTGEEWGLNNGYRYSEGHWFAGGVYRYSIQNSGIPPEGFEPAWGRYRSIGGNCKTL